jgi:hypothetical protein
VNTLSGYVEKPNGRVIMFSIQVNAHDVRTRQILAQIDSVVVQLAPLIFLLAEQRHVRRMARHDLGCGFRSARSGLTAMQPSENPVATSFSFPIGCDVAGGVDAGMFVSSSAPP